MTDPVGAIPVEHAVGSAAAFHARDLPVSGGARVWWFELDGPAMVLGSRQAEDLVDASSCASLGAEVVRRRSGGGAVWLEPGGQVWLDVLVPADDPRWCADVRASMVWLGGCWVDALTSMGASRGDLEVHVGGLVGGAWSDLVCFAGLGPGEVTFRGRKLVGLSQRRGRWGARFQCTVHRTWRPEVFVSLFAVSTPAPVDLSHVATVAQAVPFEVTDEALAGALVAAIGRSTPAV